MFPTATAGQRDIVLDGWRGIGIIGVLLQHFIYFHYKGTFRAFTYADVHTPFLAALQWLDKVLVGVSLRAGEYGVESFFIISGFIITSLLLVEEQKYGRINLRAFYFRRIFRIMPTFYFYAACIALFGYFGWIILDYSQIPTALGFLCNTNIGTCDWNLIHTWTLATEEQFYIIWPLLFILVPKKHRAAFMACTVVALLAASSSGLFYAQTWIDNGRSFVCIGLGVLYALSEHFRSFVQHYALKASGIALAIIAAMNFLPGYLSYDFTHLVFRELTPFFILTAIVLSYRLPKYLLDSMLWLRLSQLGLISYSVYIWQQVFTNLEIPAGSPILFAWLLIPAALFSYFVIERPAMRFAKGYLKKDSWFSRQFDREPAI